MKTRIITLIGLSLFTSGLFAQNLIDMSGWSIGTGSITGFSQNGSTAENIREWGEGPHGNRVILWKASPDAAIGPDGGWNTSYIRIDHTKMYRLSVWIKKINSNNGTTYLSTGSIGGDVINVETGVSSSNPHFFSSDLPELGKWYLLVSYVHGSGDNSTTPLGVIYDGLTGKAVQGIRDFKFQTSTTHIRHRSYLFNNPNTSDRQYFYAPRMEEVNGNEPSISELLSILPTSLAQLSIGTDNLPAGYKLSVGGDAIMEKVKVQTEGSWPDYVFAKDYALRSLDELKEFIAKNGHLPNVPSAKEIKESNQDLGLIQLKLLEKIEELTLYTIEQEKEISNSKSRITQLEAENQEMKDRLRKIEELVKTLISK
jgi:hypothetical protein